VDIIVRSEKDGLSIAVKDTGIGIPAENIDRVMRPFEQVQTTYSRTQGGTGLGLPYSAKLAELHEGAIRLESEPDKGTTATLWLPPSRVVKAQTALKAVG
jgi:two-component system cell cycle sensor histidine kinase PleC